MILCRMAQRKKLIFAKYCCLLLLLRALVKVNPENKHETQINFPMPDRRFSAKENEQSIFLQLFLSFFEDESFRSKSYKGIDLGSISPFYVDKHL